MGEKIIILLRDLSPHKGPCTMLVDVRACEEENCISNVGNLFKEFAKKANKFHNTTKTVDVYIGIWANQFYFTMPPEFFKLISKTGWRVEVDFND